MDSPVPVRRSYDAVAPIYDGLSRLWTGGGIAAAGRAVLGDVRPGMRVLMLGVGAGRDAAALAKAGAQLTLVDLSPRMLHRAKAHVQSAAPAATLSVVCGDALELPLGDYDLVCTHYFLNVFDEGALPSVMRTVAAQVKPGGLWSIADFAVPASWLARLHYRVPMEFFAGLGLCARHPVYDYAALLPRGVSLERVLAVPVFGVGPKWHRAWICRRDGDN